MSFYGLIPEGTGGQLVEIQLNVNLAVEDDNYNTTVLGLAGPALRQGQRRWEMALQGCGLALPQGDITINLPPAGVPKPGTTLEAAIAAVLSVQGAVLEEPENVEAEQDELDAIRARNEQRRKQRKRVYENDWVIVGELGLSGELRNTRSLLGMIAQAPEGASVIVPEEAADEADLLLLDPKHAETRLFTARRIDEVHKHILGTQWLKQRSRRTRFPKDPDHTDTDFADITGQDLAKRAMEIAAAGGHSVLLFGPPGEGKSMLAEALPGILPPLTTVECFEINQIYSAKGLLKKGRIRVHRPFREALPAGTTDVALLGGGTGFIEPGEISLAHRGVLFLDELSQFSHRLVNSLRAPLQNRRVTIARAVGSVEFPCNFILVAAMNPCVCGYYGEYKCSVCGKTILRPDGICDDHPDADSIHKCHCTKGVVDRHLSSLDGPFLDRIPLKVRVHTLDPDLRFTGPRGETSKAIRARIVRARKMQEKRYRNTPMKLNANVENTNRYFGLFRLADSDKRQFERVQGEKGLTYRGAVKALQVGRTIADLEGSEVLTIDHLLQAIGFMGSLYGDEEVLLEVHAARDLHDLALDPQQMSQVVARVLAEMARRRLSKNRCAREMDVSVATFNKILRREHNLSRTSVSKLFTWLEKSHGKHIRRGYR